MGRALWTVGPQAMALRTEAPAEPAPGVAVVRALWSGVSRGTEATVLAGRVPVAMRAAMRCPAQVGEFPYPVKYGYALVGRVEAGPEPWVGRAVFALHPHQEEAALPLAALTPLPEGLPPRRAVLGANMETAVNVVWDSGVSVGDRVLVLGAGVVGLLIARVIAGIPGTQVVVHDIDGGRAEVAGALGVGFAGAGAVPEGVDVAVNASGSAAGLQTAIDAVGPEGRVIEASWYGDREVRLALGGGFHPGRVTLKSSQVGRLPPERVPRWSHGRRLAAALALLADMPETEALLSHEIPFAEAPERLPPLLAPGADALCPVLRYDP